MRNVNEYKIVKLIIYRYHYISSNKTSLLLLTVDTTPLQQ